MRNPLWHIRSWIARHTLRTVKMMSDPELLSLIVQTCITRAASLPPGDGLRFLLGVEAALYPEQGRLAVAYGDGVHTKHRHMHYHDFFIRRVQAGMHVLDIGCGIGAVAYDVADRSGALVVGIDLGADNIAVAQQRFSHPNVRYVVGDALQGLPNEEFDVVILSNVLEHLPTRATFLRRVQQATHAQRFLIRVPLFERDWRVPLKQELGVEWRLDPTHEVEYTLEVFSAEMCDAGLTILYQEVRWGEIWADLCVEGATTTNAEPSSEIE